MFAVISCIVSQLPPQHPPVTKSGALRALGSNKLFQKQVFGHSQRRQLQDGFPEYGRATGYYEYIGPNTIESGGGFRGFGMDEPYGLYAALRAKAREIGEPVCYASMQQLPTPDDAGVPTVDQGSELISLSTLAVERLDALRQQGYPVVFSGVSIGSLSAGYMCENAGEFCAHAGVIPDQPVAMAVFKVEDDDQAEEKFWEMYKIWTTEEHGFMDDGHGPNIAWAFGACRNGAGEEDYEDQSCPIYSRSTFASGSFWGNGGGLMANIIKCSDFPAEYTGATLGTSEDDDVDSYVRMWTNMNAMSLDWNYLEDSPYESKISLLNLRTSTPFTPPMNDSAVAGLLYPQCETDEDCAYDGCSTYSMCLDPGLGAEVGNFCYQVYPESSFMCEDKSNGETIDAGQINWGVCYDGDRIDVCPVATCPEGCSYKAYNPFERNRVGRKLLFGSTPSSGCPAGCH